MAQQTRVTLKSYFETGDTPTEAEYVDLIDSMLTLIDDTTEFIPQDGGSYHWSSNNIGAYELYDDSGDGFYWFDASGVAVEGYMSYGEDLLTISGVTPKIQIIQDVALGGNIGKFQPATLTGTRTWTFPDKSGIIPVAPGWASEIATPAASQDGAAITWNEGNNEFELAAAAGGGITGSGTTNFMTRWTSSSAIGNSTIRDDGTTARVGATPLGAYPFGVFSGSHQVSMDIINTNTGASSIALDVGISGSHAYDNVGIDVGAIGSTTLNTGIKIVQGGGALTSPNSGNYIGFRSFIGSNTGAANYNFYGESKEDNSLNNIGLYVDVKNAGAGEAYGIIVENGNVGFGTLAPDARLHIVGENNDGGEYSIIVTDNAGTPENLFMVENDGTVGIGILSSPTIGGGKPKLHIVGELSLGILLQATNTVALGGSILNLYRSRGTIGSEDFVLNGDSISIFNTLAWNGTQPLRTAAILVEATENHTASDLGTNMKFNVTTNGSTSTNTALFIDNSRSIGIGTITPNASAILHLESTNRGFLPPVMTTTNMNSIITPEPGLLIYDETTEQWMGFRGVFAGTGAWVIIG